MHNSHLTITDIALQCGFPSSAAFSRAFKERFGVSATVFRNQYEYSKNCKVQSNNRKESPETERYNSCSEAAAEHTERRRLEPVKVEVRTLPAYNAAYVRILDGMEEGYNHKITEAFDTARDWVGARNLFTSNTLCIGAVYETVKLAPKEKRRYDACFTVPEWA
jgi:AraC family transcriptional regulator